MNRLRHIIPVTLILSAWASAGLAAQPYGDVSDIVDLNGVKAEQAEKELGERGYRRVFFEGVTSNWWNEETKTCAQIPMTGGGVSDVESVPLTTCGR